MTVSLARRMARAQPSAVREILKVAEQPEVLSFAGGLPAPELFPLAALAEAHARVFAREGAAALQYSTTEGFAPLRAWIAARLRGQGVAADVERILVTAGSQQGIDLAARALLDPGDRVAVESPSYLAALQAFELHGARAVAVPGDAEGLRVDALEALHRAEPLRMVYVVPNFQNPTGATLSAGRRAELVAFAARQRIAVVEDDPYGALRFEGRALPPLAALDDAGVVLYLGTFSKTLAPGLRLAWASGPAELMRAMTIAKQAADLHTATLAQRAVAALLETFDYDGHLDLIRAAYRERRDALLAALERHLPAGCDWTRPEGGMFTWLTLPHGLEAEPLLAEALKAHVAFVPGRSFYATAPRLDTLRLNFSNRPPELIDEGMARLGRVVGSALADRSSRHGQSLVPSSPEPARR